MDTSTPGPPQAPTSTMVEQRRPSCCEHGLDDRDDVAERIRRLEREVEQLRRAVVSHREVGVVTGLLAQRLGCTTEQAFALLVRMSRNTNIKMREVARVVADCFDGRSRPADAPVVEALTSQLPGATWPSRQPGTEPPLPRT